MFAKFARPAAQEFLALAVTTALVLASPALALVLPAEPLEIGHAPQFVCDLFVVDATWGLKPKGEAVRRVAHAAQKHPANPLLTGDGPSHLWAGRAPDGRFRLWYQANVAVANAHGRYVTSVALAESDDGVHWQKPALNLFPDAEKGQLPPNAVIHLAGAPQCEAGAPQLLDVPARDARGFRYLMLYLMRGAPLFGLHLIGSPDGVHWDAASDTLLAQLPSDTHNTLHYDPARDEYVLFCRSKHIYHALGQTKEPLSGGESRRGISRLTSKTLWTGWTNSPQTILLPDERDAALGYNYFMAMPVAREAGVWWAALAPFLWNDLYASEIAWSRDGLSFERLPERAHFIEFGPAGAWDHSMVVACPRWIEVGDQWWFYYAGWNGPHDSAERTGAIGLATLRKEGFISQHAPATGGVVCTRALRWPGGPLCVNADAHAGELRVRVSDALRHPRRGFDYDDAPAFTGNRVSHEWTWKGQSLDALKGQVIRLEFFLKNADLYSFRAGPEKEKGSN